MVSGILTHFRYGFYSIMGRVLANMILLVPIFHSLLHIEIQREAYHVSNFGLIFHYMVDDALIFFSFHTFVIFLFHHCSLLVKLPSPIYTHCPYYFMAPRQLLPSCQGVAIPLSSSMSLWLALRGLSFRFYPPLM